MNLQVKLALHGNLGGFAESVHLRIAAGARRAAERMAARAKAKLRGDTLDAGLGSKVANAWRADIYPRSASVHTHTPAVQIYSKAPLIMRAFGADTTIVPKHGVCLAIPTDNVPHHGRRFMTPVEVEARFNQDLIFKASKKAGVWLAFVNVVRSKNGKSFRPPTKGRLRGGRKAELVLMFVMVKQVHLAKRLSWPEIFKDLESEWKTMFVEEINAALEAGAN